MLHEHRRRQYDIGHLRGLGHELFMHRREQVFARKTLSHERLLGRDRHRIGVLDQHRLDRTAAAQRLGITGQDAADLGLIKQPRRMIDRVVTLDDGLIEMPERVIVEERAATFILPGTGHRRYAQRRMHLRGAVAAAGKAIAEAEEGALGFADRAGKGLDLLDRNAANRRRPFRAASFEMRLELTRAIGIFFHIFAIGIAVAEQRMHHAAGERAVGARPQDDLDVGLLHGVVVVDIDGRDPGATFLAGTGGVRHHIDLGVHRIGAPDHDQVGDAHLAWIDARDLAGADGKSDAGDIGADRLVEARIFLHMRKAVDAVAHHEAHGACVVIRPDRFGAEVALGLIEAIGDLVERFVPRNPRELPRALRPRPAHRIHQPIGVMNALGIARDLGADDAGGIGLQLGAAHPADAAAFEHLDVQRARRRAVVRTGGMPDIDLGVLVHTPIGNIKIRGRRAHLSGNACAKTATRYALCAEIGPAIGVDRLPGDVARTRAAQETHHCGDVLGSSAVAGQGLMRQMMRRFRLVLRPQRAD